MDVSHLIDHSDEGQDAHDAMHPDVALHIARAFAHHAGVGKDPGKYVPTDKSDSEQDAEGQKAENQSQAIANVADFSNVPEIPASTAPQTVAPPKPGLPSAKPPFEEL
jgi:hypothetical protein